MHVVYQSILKKIFVLCIIILGGVSCDPPEHLKTHYTYLYVKNATNKPISITTVPGHLMSIFTIISGDSVCFHSFCPPQHWGIPSFNGLYAVSYTHLVDALKLPSVAIVELSIQMICGGVS